MCYADIGSYDSAVADLRVVVLIQQRANDIVYKLVFAIGHIQGKGSDKSEECEHSDFAAYLCNSFHYYLILLLICGAVVKLNERGVKRLLAQNDGHVAIYAVTHILTGNGTAVFKVMLYEDEVEAEVPCLLFHESVNAEHALAQAMLSFMRTMSQLKFFAHSQMALTLSQPPTAW